MKKYILCLAAASALFACDPIEDRDSLGMDIVNPTKLAEGIVIVQKDIDGNAADDGNYISYSTNPSTIVNVYTLKADGSENTLAIGASGSFVLAPSRGSDPNQTVYFKALNPDNTYTTVEKIVNVYVATDLPADMKLAVSDSGEKIWKWDTEAPDGVVWGNMGYCGGANDWNTSTAGKWWGVTSEEEFLGQLNHSNTGTATGEESMDAYMVWKEDGSLLKYNSNGNLLNTGSFKIVDYNPEGEWRKGILETSAGAILWPFQINAHDNDPSNICPTQFEIVHLSVDKMVLVYPDKGDFGALGNWGEASFWRFASSSDKPGLIAGYGEGNVWTWNTDGKNGGIVWGNMGYCGGNGAAVYTNSEGRWWGVGTEDEFLGQLEHSDTGVATGEENLNAYMIFKQNGDLEKYDANGKQLKAGTWKLDTSVANDWKVANLETTAGTILWPFQINAHKNDPSNICPTTFEVVYLSGDAMSLVYPDNGNFDALGGWGEATFWHFKRK